MTKRVKGPIHYTEWVALLSQPLTDESALLLGHGKLKEKALAVSLFNRISDYVVEEYNHRVEAVKTAEFSELIFALRKFSAGLSRSLFFLQLEFLSAEHKEALLQSLRDATKDLIRTVSEKFRPQDADLLFELNVLRRKAGAGANE